LLEPKLIAALRKLEEAVNRLEKAVGRTILGRQKAGTQYWTSEIRKPNLEDAHAIAVIAASPYSPYYEWKVIVVDRRGEFLAAQGVATDLNDAKMKIKEKVENLYIWEGEKVDLVWDPPLDTVEGKIKETMRGYRRWGVRFPEDPQGAYRVLVVWDERKRTIEVKHPVARKTYSVIPITEESEEQIEEKIKEKMKQRFGREVVLEEILPPEPKGASEATQS
jgi:vacuolar-type H+-ATPase subunit F/Vma7